LSSQPSIPYVGVLVEITSYTTARGLVLVTEGTTSIVTYGNLAVISDAEDPDKKYLATIVDVREKGTLPAIDHNALKRIYQSIASQSNVSLKSVAEALREIVFPGVHRQYGLREVDLQILGELLEQQTPKGKRLVLTPHKRPPRPYSTIEEADADTVNKLVAHDCNLMVLGNHFVVDGALVTLDPERLDTHIAIVTGSGKTETVKRVALEFYARAPTRKSLIIMDITGEYLGYPYMPPTSPGGPVPLFQAILDPKNYVCEPRPHCRSQLATPNRPNKTTILVPYNPSDIGKRKRDEQNYFARGFPPLWNSLTKSYGPSGYKSEIVLFGRHSIYTLDPKSGYKNVVEMSLADAWTKIQDAPDLIVAAPTPDALTIDEIIELSGTQSGYAGVAIAGAASSLGLLQGDIVAGVNFLSGLTKLFDLARNKADDQDKVPLAFKRIGEQVVLNLQKHVGVRKRKGHKLNKYEILNIVKNAVMTALNSTLNAKLRDLPRDIFIDVSAVVVLRNPPPVAVVGP